MEYLENISIPEFLEILDESILISQEEKKQVDKRRGK